MANQEGRKVIDEVKSGFLKKECDVERFRFSVFQTFSPDYPFNFLLGLKHSISS